MSAVQAVYQLEVANTEPARLVREFVKHRLGQEVDGDTYVRGDEDLFRGVVLGVADDRGRLDRVIDSHLARGKEADRLEAVLLAVLRCGVWELLERPETPAPIVIAEYVDVAKAFYQGRESAIVNAVLDKVARPAADPSEPAENGG